MRPKRTGDAPPGAPSAGEQLRLTDQADADPGAERADRTGRPRHTPDQRAAIEAGDPYVFVEAGAGTGKTGVLVDRYCDAVEATEGGVGAVLAITFTEKAAGELRARIRAELRRRAAEAGGAGESERELRLISLARAPAAWVTTIHGFCRRLLAAHPVAAGVDPRFRVLEPVEAELLAERAFADAVEELLAEPDPDRLALVAARSAPQLRDLVRGAHDELRSLGHERPELGELLPPDLAGALAALAEAAREALAETAAATGGNAVSYRERLAGAAALAEAAGSRVGAGGAAGSPGALGGGAGATPPPTISPDDLLAFRIDSKAKAFCGPAMARYGEALDRAVERAAVGLYEAVGELVRLFGRRYAELKAERAGLDFEDLQLRALALLRHSPRVRAAYRERFAELLVDEFQDTNRLQVDLISELRGPATRLFTVGDEFQSIYAFRHADVEVFRTERRRANALPLSGNFRSSPAVLAALNVVGEALLPDFRPLTAGREHAPAPGSEPAVELALVPAEGWEESEVGLGGREELDAAPQRVAEAAALAERLVRLAEAGIPRGEMVVLLRAFTHVGAYEEALERAGLRPLVVGGRGYWSQQQVEDMRCLLGVVANPLDDELLLGALASPACAASPDALWLLRRAAGKGRHLWPELARRFGARAEGATGTGERDPGREHGADPGDRRTEDAPGSGGGEAEAGQGARPDGGAAEADQEAEAAEADEEAEAAERERAAAAIPPEDAQRLRDFCRTIEALRAEAALEPLDALVDRVARELGYDLAVLMREGGRRRWANVRKLMQVARAYEQAAGRDLTGFVATIAARAERDDREPEAATEIEGHDGVRVMTVHSAKGLEFGVVAVADLGRELAGGGFAPAFRARQEGDGSGADSLRTGVRIARAGRESLRVGDLGELADRARTDESEEERRLAYVAATRARERLVLSGSLDLRRFDACLGRDEAQPGDPILHRLLPALGVGVADEELVLTAEGGDPVPLGEGATVTPPAPGGGRAELAIRVELPRPGRGEELMRRRSPAGEPAAAPAASGDGAPAGKEAPPASVLASRAAARPSRTPGRLSSAAFESYASCGYRYYVERLVGLRASPGTGNGGAPGAGAAFGSAVHALLEWSARNRWLEPPAERAASALRDAGLDPEAERLERARGMVAGWLASPLRAELEAERSRLAPEAPFLLGLGGAVVRGKLDLLAEGRSAVPLVIDYKTNALEEEGPTELMHRYEIQRDVYALAVASGAENRAAEVRTAFVFLERPDEPVIEVHGPERIEATRERLATIVAGITAERFEVTEHPHRALCHDCPAREALCPHPPERTLAP